MAGLTSLLEEPLVVVDVGARWGFSTSWEVLGDSCLAFGFEPDAAECERLTGLLRAAGSRHRLVPLALGERRGLATLHLTREPACSSLYPPSLLAAGRHPALGVITPVGTTIVELGTLDEWCAAEGIARVDALKVDTQGSELGVLAGGSATLAGVRAVEVEVEFNELYVGAPLFGEVDRFLRARGFVLWALRDLSHYAQGAVPGPSGAGAASSGAGGAASSGAGGAASSGAGAASSGAGGAASSGAAGHAPGAGQLFWANAFYLRESVAYPQESLGWGQLVRDACLTGVLGFGDLSARALELAAQSAPPAPSDVITASLSPGTQVPPAPVVRGSSIKVATADRLFAGGGWHGVQPHPCGGLRWSGPGRDAWLDVGAVVQPGTRVEVLAVAQAAASFTVSINGCPLVLMSTPHEHGVLHTGILPSGYRSARGFTRIMVGTPGTVAWNVVDPGSDDDQEVGVAIAWVRLCQPGPGVAGAMRP